MIEEAKLRCVKAKIKIDVWRFNAAVAKVNSRIAFKAPEHKRELFHESRNDEPLTHAEACEALARYGLGAWMKHVPEVKQPSPDGQHAMRKYGLYMQAIQEQIKRCEEAERAAQEAECKP